MPARSMPSPTPSDTTTLPDRTPVKRYTVYIGCVPARTVVLLVVVFLLIFAVLLVAIGWIVEAKIDRLLSNLQRVAMFFHILDYLFVAIVCIVGLHAGIKNRRKASQLFVAALATQLPFGIASGAACLHILFTASAGEEQVTQCTSLSEKILWTEHICKRSPVLKALLVVAFLHVWVLELVVVYAASRFTRQLQEEELDKANKNLDNDSMYGDC